jgi:hypothetical protein
MKFIEALEIMSSDPCRRFRCRGQGGTKTHDINVLCSVVGSALLAHPDPQSRDRYTSGLSVTDALRGNWEEVVETHDFVWAKEQLKAGRLVARRATANIRVYDMYSTVSLEDIDATDWVLA